MLELNKSYRILVEKYKKKLFESAPPRDTSPLMRDSPDEILANPGIIIGPNGQYLNWRWDKPADTSPNFSDMIPNSSQFDLFPNGQWSVENFNRLIGLVDQYIGDIPSLIAYLENQGIGQETITFLNEIYGWYQQYGNVMTSSMSNQTQSTALGALFANLVEMQQQFAISNPQAYSYFLQLMAQNDGGNPEGVPYGHELTRYLTILFCMYGAQLWWEQNTV